MESIYGINAVSEALKARGRAIQYVAVARERHDARLQKLIEECKHAGVSVRLMPKPYNHPVRTAERVPRLSGAAGQLKKVMSVPGEARPSA